MSALLQSRAIESVNNGLANLLHENYTLLLHEISIGVLHVVTSCVPDGKAFLTGQLYYVEGSIFILKGFDKFTFSLLYSMRDNRRKKWWPSPSTFHGIFPQERRKAVTQLICFIASYL